MVGRKKVKTWKKKGMKVRTREAARGLFKMTRLKGRALRWLQRGEQRGYMQENEMGEEES